MINDIEFNDFLKLVPSSVYNRDPGTDTGIKKLFALYADMFNRLSKIIGGFTDDSEPAIGNLKLINLQSGAVLDQIGQIVKEPRRGRTDDNYRKYLKIAIKRNVSNGSLSTAAEITRLISERTDYIVEELRSGEEGTPLDAEPVVKEYPAFDCTWILNPYVPRPAVFKVNVPGINAEEKTYLENTINEIKSAGVEAIVTS